MTTRSGQTFFTWAALKTLSVVDVDIVRSNQHEIGGVAPLHRQLVEAGVMTAASSEHPLNTAMIAVGFGDEVERVDESLRLYDARRHNPDRAPEWRIYYPAGGAVEETFGSVSAGDLLVYAIPRSGPDLVLIVARSGSAWETIVRALFPVNGTPTARLFEVEGEALAAAEDAAPLMLVLEEFGLAPAPDQSLLDWILLQPEVQRGLGGLEDFPTTTEMATLARRRLAGVADGLPVDDRLMAYLDAESEIFFAIESAIALPLFEECLTTPEYMDLAKSLTQRRASRRGRSFEIHLEGVFAEEALTFAAQAPMPSGERLDFLFPSLEEYLDPDVGEEILFAANAKTTVRERWRQLAGEADRLTTKHLITVDPNLSERVVSQMVEAGVRPVVVRSVLENYPPAIRETALDLESFVAGVAATQE